MYRGAAQLSTPRLWQDRAKLWFYFKGFLVLGVPFAFLLHLGIAWLDDASEQRSRAHALLAHSRVLHSASLNLLSRMSDAQAAMNAYLSGKRTEDLQSYRAIEESAPQLLTAVSSAAGKDGKKRYQSIRKHTETLLDELSALVPPTDEQETPHEAAPHVAAANNAMRALNSDLAELNRDDERASSRALETGSANTHAGMQVALHLGSALAGCIAAMLLFLKTAEKQKQRAMQEAALERASAIMASYEVFKAELIGPSGSDAVRPGETAEPGIKAVLDSSAAPMYIKDAAGQYAITNGRCDSWLQQLEAGKVVPGQVEPVEVALYRPDGSQCGTFGVLIDAPSRERPEINWSEIRVWRAVLDCMTDGVVVLDGRGECLFSNPAAMEMLGGDLARFGLKRDEGSTPCSSEDLSMVQALLGRMVQRDIHVQRTGSSSGVWLSASATPLKDDSGRICGAVGVFSDITSRRNTEDALSHAKEDAERAKEDAERAKEEAEQANRAKSEFLSRMSHELRTPLNAILGFAQLLNMGRLPEQHQDSVEQILKGGRHLLSLINEVLDIARIESGRLSMSLEDFGAFEAVQESVTLVEPQATKRRIQLYIESGPASRMRITADRQRFKQVVLNLLSNAVKYNREGGSVRISAEARDGQLRLSVADTGPGIPPEKIGLLFSPFERLGAEHGGVEGTGIGLALSKRLVEAMNGRVGVQSEVGEGTVFWIDLPIAMPGVRDIAEDGVNGLHQLQNGLTSGRSPVVLCIEDNDSNFRLIERTLAQRPEITIRCSKLGAAGISSANENPPDLILLDMHLPDLHGSEVLLRLRRNPRTANVPVVVVSADATPPQIERMLNAGAKAYLTKPLDIEKLLEAVDGFLNNGTEMTICSEA